jgi:3-dehydroquinate synthase
MANKLKEKMFRVSVELGDRSYPIDISPGLLSRALPATVLEGISKAVLISNEVVFPIYGEQLRATLAASGVRVESVVLPDGESFKDWRTLNLIFDALLASASDRKTLLVALGGGVVGDMVGFAAATYLRGIAFVQVPTTLLAQVDSSVGGKTAINHPLGKNMIGAFHQPKHVLVDTDVLQSLPEREYKAGLAEVVKYGAALDVIFFRWLEGNIDALCQRRPEALAYAIRRSCEIKAGVVAGDELESSKEGGRALLNFGHTFAHAIETVLGYGVWLHGEAVACGMAIAARLSAELGRIPATECRRLEDLISRAGLDTELPSIIGADTMLEHMTRDKKNEAGTIKLILLSALGESNIDAAISRQTLYEFLQRQNG